jgi:hypothetical protein
MSTKIDTPLEALIELIPWHTPEIVKVIELTEPPNGGGSFRGNFWLYCMRQGFLGHTAGTINFPQSHGWYLHPKDRRNFRAWLKNHLATLNLIPSPQPMKTKVIFRKFPSRQGGEVIALFPELPGTMDPHTCESYMHTGQHGAASVDLGRTLRLATPEEYEPLKRELESAPFNYVLEVVSRFPASARATRQSLTK